MSEKRFMMRNDGNGRWSVIDADSGTPAIARDCLMTALEKEEAADIAAVLNMAASMQGPTARSTNAMQPRLQPFFLPIR